VWELSCPSCEKFLRETDLARDINKPDRHSPRNAKLPAHIVGNWSDSVGRIPLTPDELEIADQLEAQGTREMAQNAQRVASESLEAAKLRNIREQEEFAREAERHRHEAEMQLMATKIAQLEQLISGQHFAPPAPAVPSPGWYVDEAAPAPASGSPCADCGKIRTRQPGQKGPMPKFCDDCRTKAKV
jgi:hypothetical protein